MYIHIYMYVCIHIYIYIYLYIYIYIYMYRLPPTPLQPGVQKFETPDTQTDRQTDRTRARARVLPHCPPANLPTASPTQDSRSPRPQTSLLLAPNIGFFQNVGGEAAYGIYAPGITRSTFRNVGRHAPNQQHKQPPACAETPHLQHRSTRHSHTCSTLF